MQNFLIPNTVGKSAHWPLILTLCALLSTGQALADTYTVQNLNDNGTGSLREAIGQANSTAADDEIVFAPELEGTITLNSSITVENYTAASNTLHIDGDARISISVNQSLISEITNLRIFIIDATANATLAGLQIMDGSAAGGGGGIYNGGTLTINDSTLSGNAATNFNGGGIANRGTLTINNSIFSENSASGSGGGIDNFNGILNVNNSTFSENVATVYGGGIANRGTLTINDSTLSGNSANYGAAIINSLGTLTVNNSTLSANVASSRGGGIDNEDTLILNNATLYGNSANQFAGGGIYSAGETTVTLNNSTLSENSAIVSGGGIYTRGSVTLNNSIIGNNTSAGDANCSRADGTINASHSLIEGDLSCINGSNINNLSSDPVLGTLAGSPAYLPLLPGSDAIDAGNNVLIPEGINTDQAGNPRISNITVDMGAVEFQGPVVNLSAAASSVIEGGSTTLTISRTGETTAALVVTLEITPGNDTTTGDYSLSGGDISGQSGTVSVTIPATQISVELTLEAITDGITEVNESLTFGLSNVATYHPGAPDSTIVTIENLPTLILQDGFEP